MSDRPEDPFDERLRAALRHAPDHDATPPPAVSARVLDAAREAVAGPARPAPHGGWSRLRAWLATLGGPGPRAAFASLVLVGVIGLMWRDGPPPDADTFHEPAASDKAAPPVAAAPQATAPAIDGPTAQPSPPPSMPPPVTPPAPAPAPAAAPRPAPTAPPAEARRAEASAARAAPAPEQPKAAAAEHDGLEAAPPAAAAAAGPRAESVAPAEDRPPTHAQVPDPLAAAAARWQRLGATAADAAAPPPPGRAAESMRLREALPAAGPWPDWLAQARQATAGGWGRSPVGPQADAAQPVPDPDGGPELGRIELQAEALLWQARGDTEAWRALLTPSASEALRAALPAR